MQFIIPSLTAIISGTFMYYVGQHQFQQTLKQKEIQQETVIDTFKNNTISSPIRNINYSHFRIIYSTVFSKLNQYHKSPLAVHQLFTKDLVEGKAPRSRFFEDENIEKIFRANNSHYAASLASSKLDLNRGHMAAAGNYSGNQEAKFQTFSYANVVPQNKHNNSGIWNTFERYARNLAVYGTCKSVQVISGPIYFKNNPYSQDKNLVNNIFKTQSLVLMEDGVIVPEKLYKIIKCNRQNASYFSAFQFQNKDTSDNHKQLNEFKTTLQSISQQTGLVFNIQGKSLQQVDKEGLNKTKLVYDDSFYQQLLSKSDSIFTFDHNLYRAYSQKIPIDLLKYTEQLQKMKSKDILKIKQQQQSSQCQKLHKLMKLNKKLLYLKVEDFQIEMKPIYQESFQQCIKHKSQETEQQKLKIIKQILKKNQNKKNFKYLLQQELQKQFLQSQANEEVSQNIDPIIN